MTLGDLVLLLVSASSIWVVADASRLGVRRGVIGGGHWADVGVLGWLLLCVLLWIVAFPAYLATRPKYVALREQYPRGPIPEAAARRKIEQSWQAREVDRQVGGRPGSTDAAELLRQLGDLHASGVLTDEEFQSKKRELLARL